MSPSFLLLNNALKSSSQKYIKSVVARNLSSKVIFRPSPKNRIKYGLAGITLTSGIAVLVCKNVSYNRELEYLKQKIQEFLDCFKGSFIVECEEKVKQNRTAHYEETIGTDTIKRKSKQESFDWTEFLKLVWKEKFYFLTAVAVSDYYFFSK